jgi:hypothetical protein
MVFHALHVAGRDLRFVNLFSTIPLFATCAAASAVGLLLGGLGMLAVADPDSLLARLPKVLGVAIALFTIEIVLFP